MKMRNSHNNLFLHLESYLINPPISNINILILIFSLNKKTTPDHLYHRYPRLLPPHHD